MESGFSGYGKLFFGLWKVSTTRKPGKPEKPKKPLSLNRAKPEKPENPKNHFANLGGSGSGFSGYGDLASRSEVVIRVNRVSWKWLIGL